MTREECQLRAISGNHCFLFRNALEYDQVDWSLNTRSSAWWVAFKQQEPEHVQLFAYLTESLVTALYSDERDVATRSAFQAKGYLERLIALQKIDPNVIVGGPRYHDAVREAIERVVDWVRITMKGN